MTRSVMRQLRDAAHELGFWVESATRYVRRVPGEPRNETWYETVLLCPCGALKRLHVKASSLPDLRAHLRDHLIRDGLLEGEKSPA